MSAATAPSPVIQENATRQQETEELRWAPAMTLPCRLTVDVPLPDFDVRDFLGLHPGSVVGTKWSLTRDLPLRINGTLIAWGEMEGSGNGLMVRITELV